MMLNRVCKMCGVPVHGKRIYCWQCRVEKDKARSRVAKKLSTIDRALSQHSNIKREAINLFRDYWQRKPKHAAAELQKDTLKDEQRRHDEARAHVRKRIAKIFELKHSVWNGKVFVDMTTWQIRARFSDYPETAVKEWRRLCADAAAQSLDYIYTKLVV